MLLFIQLHFLCQAFSPRSKLFDFTPRLHLGLNYTSPSGLKTRERILRVISSFCPIKIGFLLGMTRAISPNSLYRHNTNSLIIIFVPVVEPFHPLLHFNGVFPPQCIEFGYIGELAHCAIGLGGIEGDCALIPHPIFDEHG